MFAKAQARKLASLLVVLLLGLVALAFVPLKAEADPVSMQNVEVNATATGGVNGPYTITLTAQQTREPQSGEVNWDGSTKIKYALGPLWTVRTLRSRFPIPVPPTASRTIISR